MIRLCRRYINDEAQAMEVASEGFVKVYKNIHRFEPRQSHSLKAWMKKIMINESLGQLRKGEILFMTINEQVEYVETNYLGLEELDAEYIYEAIRRLPSGYRTVFNLYVIEGYSHVEIAEELKVSASTSRSQLVQAKRKLKEIINQLTEA